MKKISKFLVIALIMVMCVSLYPVPAFAATSNMLINGGFEQINKGSVLKWGLSGGAVLKSSPMSPAPGQAELVTNGGFESSGSGWTA